MADVLSVIEDFIVETRTNGACRLRSYISDLRHQNIISGYAIDSYLFCNNT